MGIYHAIRTVIKAVRAGKIQLIDVKGRDEDFTGKELFQQYGHASRPLPESEGILLFLGGVDNAIVIATEDRRYRIALEEGEVALYTDEGDKVHLKRNKEIHIKSGNKVKIEATTIVEVIAPTVNVTAATEANITAPTANVAASTVANVTAPAVNLGAASGGKTIATSDFITLYNTHTHPQSGGGNTSAPTQQGGSSHKTAAVKAT